MKEAYFELTNIVQAEMFDMEVCSSNPGNLQTPPQNHNQWSKAVFTI